MGEERKEREVCGQKNYVWNHILDWYAGGEIEERREENQNIGRSRWNYKRWKIIKGWKKEVTSWNTAVVNTVLQSLDWFLK